MKPAAINPGKLFYRISEVSQMTGLEAYVLRYWETEFPMLRPKKSRGGQRTYVAKDIELVLLIKQMLYEEGFTIAGARKRLARRGSKGEKRDWPLFLGQVKRKLEEILKIVQTIDEKDRPVRG